MQALDGLLVVSIEQAVAAPLCTARLAQSGARVIKIERDEGDFARGYDTAAKGESSYFTWLNQGKESVCLDFKSNTGASQLWSILNHADVLIQNLSPGALSRAGFSTAKLHAANPRLIVCNISGYGNSGKAASKRAYDLLVQAESGLVSVSGSSNAPGRIGVSVCDIGAGMTAYSAILEALLLRNRTDRGDELSVSLFDVAADWMCVPYLHATYGDGAPKPVGLRHPSIAPYGAFACSDNRLVLISIQNEREWARLCEQVLHSTALRDTPAYKTNNSRVANRETLERDITQITSTLSSSEFQQRLESANIAFGAINAPDDLSAHPAFRSESASNTEYQQMHIPAHPVVRSSDTAQRIESRSPRLGEHTHAVLAEFSGKQA